MTTKKPCCICGNPATSYGFDIPARRIYHRFCMSCREIFEGRLTDERNAGRPVVRFERWLEIIEEERAATAGRDADSHK